MDRDSRISIESFIQPTDDVVSISPSSSKRRQAPHSPHSPSLFSSVNIFRRSSHRRQSSRDFQETIHLQHDVTSPSSPPLTSPPLEPSLPPSAADTNPLGISNGAIRRTSLVRVPVGSKVGSPVTPSSQHHLMSSPRSPPFTRSPTWDRGDTIYEQEVDIGHVQRPDPAGYSNLNLAEAHPSDGAPYVSSSDTDNPGLGGPGQEDLDKEFSKKFEPPDYCSSRTSVKVGKGNWLTLTIYALSVYSTVMSGIWLVTSILQPRWGHQISSRHGLQPASATLLAALAAKTIEISFVTVFVSCLGQVLSRKSLLKNSRGMTLAEMTMRNWVIQPGSLVTHFESLPYAGATLLGALSLTATIAALLYTTASDAMISPKLKYGEWEFKSLSGHVRASYANIYYVSESCTSVLGKFDETFSQESCISVQFAGQSYRNLMSFMATWSTLQENGIHVPNEMKKRPTGSMLLYDNTTMLSSWVETDYSNVAEQFEKSGRIINNVSLSFPNPNVLTAATSPVNDILQPDDLAGVGEYSINAAVVSPTINVLCANINRKELAPLVYTQWPNSKTKPTTVGNQTIGLEHWEKDVPPPTNKKGEVQYLNSTVMDDIFKWGKKYGRQPPVFSLYPNDYNLVTNSTVQNSDSLYMLGKNPNTTDFSLCELRSWVSPTCMTQFNISGTGGANMRAVCEDEWDRNSFHPTSSFANEPVKPANDWRSVADAWRSSMDLNGGFYNNNASNARILTQLGLMKPDLPSDLPSLAEALAVFASSTIVIGAIDSPFVLDWHYTADKNILPEPGALEKFDASLATQQYTSGHTANWQKIFYVVLGLVFAINLFCLVYLIVSSGAVTDFTEPQNLFALAINSPPNVQLQGSCGGGPEKRDLVVPWKVSHAPGINHYFFEEANERPWRGKYAKEAISSAVDLGESGRSKYRATVTVGKA